MRVLALQEATFSPGALGGLQSNRHHSRWLRINVTARRSVCVSIETHYTVSIGTRFEGSSRKLRPFKGWPASCATVNEEALAPLNIRFNCFAVDESEPGWMLGNGYRMGNEKRIGSQELCRPPGILGSSELVSPLQQRTDTIHSTESSVALNNMYSTRTCGRGCQSC